MRVGHIQLVEALKNKEKDFLKYYCLQTAKCKICLIFQTLDSRPKQQLLLESPSCQLNLKIWDLWPPHCVSQFVKVSPLSLPFSFYLSLNCPPVGSVFWRTLIQTNLKYKITCLLYWDRHKSPSSVEIPGYLAVYTK